MNKQTNKAGQNFQKLQIVVMDKCWGVKCKTQKQIIGTNKQTSNDKTFKSYKAV